MRSSTATPPTIYQAVILATSCRASRQHVNILPCLAWLGDRIVLHHAIESAVRCGAKRIEIVTRSHVEDIEESVAQGDRWGIIINVTAIPEVCHTVKVLASSLAEMRLNDRVLVLDAHRFPGDLTSQLQEPSRATSVWCGEGRWAGAACGSVSTLRDCFCDAKNDEEPGDVFLRKADHRIVTHPLDVSSGAALLTTQTRLLNDEFPDLVDHQSRVRPGIQIGRDSEVSRTAKLHAPVVIGAGCQVGPHAELGPNMVVADGSIIGDRVVASDSLVMPMCYVGDSLRLKNVILSSSQLYNTRLNALLDICDEHLVADLSSHCLRTALKDYTSRCAGIVLTLLAWPLVVVNFALLKFLRRGPRLTSREILHTPAHSNELLWRNVTLHEITTRERTNHQRSSAIAMWRDLLLRVIPGLTSVIRGDIRLLGTTAHSAEEFRGIADQWRAMIQDQSSGLISEALVQFGPEASPDRAAMADVYQVMTKSRFKWLDLMRRYSAALIRGPENLRNSIAGAKDCVAHTPDPPVARRTVSSGRVHS